MADGKKTTLMRKLGIQSVIRKKRRYFDLVLATLDKLQTNSRQCQARQCIQIKGFNTLTNCIVTDLKNYNFRQVIRAKAIAWTMLALNRSFHI